MNYLLVAIGGMLGSVGRYAVGSFTVNTYPHLKFPLGTCIVNLAGCLLIGLFAGWIDRSSVYSNELRLFIMTGILGGFTTFSAFGLETVNLLREGSIGVAFLYVSISILAGFTLVLLGLKITTGL